MNSQAMTPTKKTSGLQPVLEASQIEVQRGTRLVLNLPHVAVQPGELLVIIGPNGAGKSTLLLTLALLLKPARGTIKIAGIEANKSNTLSLRRRMAMVFQEPLLLDTSVADNVATGLKMRGIGGDERQRRVDTWLKRFGMDHLAKRSAHTLSGGEAQRVSLARGFALEPEVLMLDEPFSALDAPTRSALRGDLLAAVRATNTATIMVTHDLDEALELGDRVGVLIAGELRQVGRPEEVFNSPQDAEVASFVGVDTIVPGMVINNEDGVAQVRVDTCTVEVVSPLPPGTPVLLSLRPEDVTVQADIGATRTSARNRLPGTVTELSPWRGQIRVTIDCGFSLTAAITRRSTMEMGLQTGSLVAASFKATSAHLIPRR